MFSSNKRRTCLTMALVTVGLLAATPALAGPVVIAHAGVADAAVTAADLQAIFLGKQTTWSDGATIELGVLGGGPVAEEFLKTYVRKTGSQFQTFWKKAVFSGTGTAPREFGTSAELAAWVAATPGAVGFVADGAASDGCKVLRVD